MGVGPASSRAGVGPPKRSQTKNSIELVKNMNKPAFSQAVDQAVEETEIEQVYNELARVRGELEVEKLKSERLR